MVLTRYANTTSIALEMYSLYFMPYISLMISDEGVLGPKLAFTISNRAARILPVVARKAENLGPSSVSRALQNSSTLPLLLEGLILRARLSIKIFTSENSAGVMNSLFICLCLVGGLLSVLIQSYIYIL